MDPLRYEMKNNEPVFQFDDMTFEQLTSFLYFEIS